MPFIVGFVTFALVCLYRDQDISKSLRMKVDGVLAHRGWSFKDDAPVDNGGVRASTARFLWKMTTCSYCLGMYVSFAATWYALWRHPWHRVFWLTWFAAWGSHCVLTAAYHLAHDATEAINKYLAPPDDGGDREPEVAQ